MNFEKFYFTIRGILFLCKLQLQSLHKYEKKPAEYMNIVIISHKNSLVNYFVKHFVN